MKTLNTRIVTLILLTAALLAVPSADASKIQKQGIVGPSDCTTRGIANSACLPDDTQVFVTANGVNTTLNAAITAGAIGGSGGGGVQLLSNPGFENGTAATGWTITTVTGANETSTIYAGSQSEKLTYSSQTGGISQSLTPSVNTSSINMEASCKVLTTMSTIEVCGLSGGVNQNCQAVPASGTWQTVTTNFVGPANGTPVGVKVDTTASGSGTVYVDDCYVGPARNLGTSQLLGPVKTSTITIDATTTAPTKGTTDIDQVAYNRVGKHLKMKFVYHQTAAGSAGSGTYLVKIPDGLTIDTALAPAQSGNVNYNKYAVGSGTWRLDAEESSYLFTFTVYDSTHLAVVVEYTGYSNPNAWGSSFGALSNSPGGFSGSAEVPIVQFSDQSTYRADSTPANASGYLVNTGNWTRASSSFGDFSGGSTSVTTRTNINMGTISAAGSQAAGISFTPPRTGRHEVCFTTTMYNTSSTTSYWEIVDGSGTVLNDGSSFNTSSNQTFPLNICSQINVTSLAAPTVVKIFGGSSAGTFTIGGGSQVAGNTISFTIKELDAPMPAPYLTGSVTSNSTTQGFRLESAVITNNGTTASIASQSGSWLSSSTRTATGKVSFVIATSEFSSAPTCWCNASVNSGTVAGNCFQDSTVSVTTTAFGVASQNSTTGSLQDQNFNVFCMGPH